MDFYGTLSQQEYHLHDIGLSLSLSHPHPHPHPHHPPNNHS
jgi:hypothetical protein